MILVLLAAALLGGQAPLAHLAAGESALRAGRLAQARVELQAAVREQPRNVEATLQLGLLLGVAGDPQAAAAAFEKCIEIDPTSAEAHYNLGLTKIAERYGKVDWQGAIAEFRKAIALRPGYPKAHHSLGAALAETGARDAAIGEFRVAARLDSGSAEDHLDLANALREAGQREQALSEYRAALRLRPDYPGAEVGWGMLLADEAGNAGALNEAIAHFRRALQSDPDDLKAQYRLAVALKRKGNTREANIAFREAQALTNRQQESVRCIRLSNEGLDAAHHDDRGAALRMLREAVALKPDSAIAHYNLGLVLADAGQLREAAAQVVEAISLSPAEARFYASLERMWALQGETAPSRRARERACGLNPTEKACAEVPEGNVAPVDPYEFGAPADTPDEHFAFGTVLARRGDWIGAAGEWLRTLQWRPGDVNARNNLAIAYSHTGQDGKAELEFRKVLQVSPESADAHFGLAVLALEHQKNAEAAEELREVLRIRPDDTKAQRLLTFAIGQRK